MGKDVTIIGSAKKIYSKLEDFSSKIELPEPRVQEASLPDFKFLAPAIKKLNERLVYLPTIEGPTFTKIAVAILMIRAIRLLSLGLCAYNVVFFPALIGALYYCRREIINDLIAGIVPPKS